MATSSSPPPHPDSDRLGRALGRCLPLITPWSGVVYRTTAIAYANGTDLLSGLGSSRHGARWTTRGGPPAVYASFDPQTALVEALGTGESYGIPYSARMPLVMVAVDVDIRRMLDLTAPSARRTLRMSLSRMLGEDWEGRQRAGEEAVTQAVARLALSLGIQGLIVPSARLTSSKNLVAFPEALAAGGLKIRDVEKLPEPKR